MSEDFIEVTATKNVKSDCPDCGIEQDIVLPESPIMTYGVSSYFCVNCGKDTGGDGVKAWVEK